MATESGDDDSESEYGGSLNTPLLRATRGAVPRPPQARAHLPRDTFYLALALFYLLGVGSLLPWNFFTTARSYFMYKFRNCSANESDSRRTYYQVTFESYLAVFANVPNIVFMFLNAAATKVVDPSKRLLSGLVIMIIVFCITCVFVKVNTDSYQTEFFWLTMACIVVINSGAALMQGSLFGLSSLFPHRYVKALMQGQAGGGVIAAVVYIGSLLLGSGPLSAGLLYFVSATCVLLLCLVGYLVLCRLPFVRLHVGCPAERANSASGSGGSGSGSGSVSPPSRRSSISFSFRAESSGESAWSALLCPGASVFLVFAVSLSLYPALLSSIEPVGGRPSLLYSPLACFLTFNLSDLVGRSLTAVVQRPRSTGALLPLSLLRLGFVPLFLMCNYRPRHQTQVPLLFSADWAPPLLVSLLGGSNGYVGTLCMIRGPAAAPPDMAETYGALMSFFLTAGLGVGSALSLAFATLL